MSKLKIKKKYYIKIPKTVQVLYCKKKNVLTLIGPLKVKSLKITNKIIFIKNENLILITQFCHDRRRQNLANSQGTVSAQVKAALIETSYNLYYKLNFVGVGYRAFSLDQLKTQFYLKLGFSHLIYFKIPKPLNGFCLKFTKLFIFGNVSLHKISQTSASLRQCKKPEPYKGKGILYEGEKIKLKKGKKI